MFYLITILISMVIIALVNYFTQPILYGVDIIEISLAVIIFVIAVIVIDLIFAYVVRRLLPEKWFSRDKTWFVAKKGERRFYERIGIKFWKDKVIELGFFTGFRKNKIDKPTDNEYLTRYIEEANFGIGCHIADIIFGFIIVFVPRFGLYVGLPVAIINAILSLLPIFILRYNLSKLHTLYNLNEKRAEKKLQTTND